MPLSAAPRALLCLIAAAAALVGAPDLASAQTQPPGPTNVTGSNIVGAAVAQAEHPNAWANRTLARRNLLVAYGAPNTTWQATIATRRGTNFRQITAADLKNMFGSRVCITPRVAEGLPRLNAEMRRARITTPARQAAFLATLAHESCVDYAKSEAYVSAYYEGRGYVQLTGAFNYRAAGNHLGVNLAGNPHLAGSLQWSAPIARWYWTVQRPHSNRAADGFDMGLISRYIGYAPSASSDRARCESFKSAYRYLSGKPAPSTTICYRH